ncbi:hypothetical protein G9A89_014309 [Geosiphon pyriformis]|nr:hypothetical protein G9A89_014309 [Geosiphon pyriformis]
MSDFPPMEEFSSGSSINLDSDPTADFLAREQAILGDDASLFANPTPPSISGNPITELEGFPEIDALSGSFTPESTSAPLPPPIVTSQPDYSAFHNDFLPIESLTGSQRLVNGQIILDQDGLDEEGEEEEESDVMREWRERQRERIAERDEVAERKKEETIQHAHSEIDKFYTDYNENKLITLQENKREEEAFIRERDNITSGTTWERVCKTLNLVSVQSKSTSKHERDVSRLKELLLDIKKDENAPGAGGY